MKKTTFTITTPVGVFTRTSPSMDYTHAVVWDGPRIREDAERERNRGTSSGVAGRWLKDRGYGTTWHLTEASARKAAAGRYQWDRNAKCVGVFAAEAA